MAAEGGRRRISDATLLSWAMVGGTFGAPSTSSGLGRALFRHKTRKQPFSAQLHGIAILQAVALAALAGWMLAA